MRKIIDDDQVGEPVRQFFAQFDPSAEANVIHVAGREVYFVVRPEPRKPRRSDRWTAAKNRRRCDLIRKDIAQTIAAEEIVELADLTRQMREHLRKVAPRVTPEMEALLADLKRTAGKTPKAR